MFWKNRGFYKKINQEVFLDKAVAVLSSSPRFGGGVGKGHLLPLPAEGNSKGTT